MDTYLKLVCDFRSNLGIKLATQLVFGVLVALVYNLEPTQEGIQNRQGLLFFISINQVL